MLGTRQAQVLRHPVANGSATAAEAVQRIGALYDIEREIRGKPADLRRQVRQARARPLVEELRSWLNSKVERTLLTLPALVDRSVI